MMNQSKDDRNTKSSRIPPDNFNLIKRAFRPTLDYKPIEGLSDKVQELWTQGRFRSALDEIFKALDMHPDHPEALRLAMLVVGGSRTGHLQAQEPLSEAYLLDNRLDPIFTVCSHCKMVSWVSTNCLMSSFPFMNTMNPAGQQCYNCGYVVCRDCLQKIPLGMGYALFSKICPHCNKEGLGIPVFPTGRLPRQMARQTAPFIHVIILREGPVPPDDEYVRKLLEVVSPDVLKGDQVTLTAFPVSSWPDDIDNLAQAILARMIVEGSLPPGSLHAGGEEFQDEYGTRVFIFKVGVQLPPEEAKPEEAKAVSDQNETAQGIGSDVFADSVQRQNVQKEKQSLLRKLFGGWMRTVRGKQEIEKLVKRHIARLHQEFNEMPRISHLYDLLLSPDIFSFTIDAMKRQIPLCMQDDRHHYLSQQFSDTIVVVSVLPSLQAMTYFPRGYFATLDSLMREFRFDLNSSLEFIHWTLCQDRFSGVQALHLSFFSPKPPGTAIFAQDLMSAAEKKQVQV